MENKELIFEELAAEHLFLFCDVIEAIGLNRFAELFKDSDVEDDEKNNMALGFNVGAVIISGLKNAKEPIYKFFAGCTNYSYDEIKNMKLVPFTRMIKEFTGKKELNDFLAEVASFLKVEK